MTDVEYFERVMDELSKIEWPEDYPSELINETGKRLMLAGALSKALSSTFRGVDAVDPAVLAAAAVALGCVAMAACIVPARQAAKVQPTRALRSE